MEGPGSPLPLEESSPGFCRTSPRPCSLTLLRTSRGREQERKRTRTPLKGEMEEQW